MRTKNDYLIQKSAYGVLVNQISLSKKYSYERKHKNATPHHTTPSKLANPSF